MNGKAFSKLAAYERIAIKIASSLLVDREKGLKAEWLQSLADDVAGLIESGHEVLICLLYTSPSPRDQRGSRMPSSA